MKKVLRVVVAMLLGVLIGCAAFNALVHENEFMAQLAVQASTARLLHEHPEWKAKTISIIADINKAIDQAKIDKDDLQKQWQSVFNEEAAVSKQIQDDIVAKFDKINQSIAKANISHRQFKESNKTIQYMGIIFICFIFTLLLLKQFDLFDFNLFGKNK